MDDDYNGTENALLLAYDLIISGIPYYVNTNPRAYTASSYKYSTVRAYLNGSYESDDTQDDTYNNAGFTGDKTTISRGTDGNIFLNSFSVRSCTSSFISVFNRV